jgi:hypothetical protein
MWNIYLLHKEFSNLFCECHSRRIGAAPEWAHDTQLRVKNQQTDGSEVVSLIHMPCFTSMKIPATHFCSRLGQPQSHSVAGRIRSIEKSSDLIGNRTYVLPAYSIVLQQTLLPHAPILRISKHCVGKMLSLINSIADCVSTILLKV